MPCPTQADVDYANALAVVAYNEMITAEDALTAAQSNYFNSQSTWYAATYTAWLVLMEFITCNGSSMTPAEFAFVSGDPMLIVPRSSRLVRQFGEARFDLMTRFEKLCPKVAEALRLKVRLDRERLAGEVTDGKK